jgi:hypothetical protein
LAFISEGRDCGTGTGTGASALCNFICIESPLSQMP